MILLGKGLDYLDIRILRLRENFVKLAGDDGTLLLDGDNLPYFLKEKMKIEFVKKSSTAKYVLYATSNESIFLNIERSASSYQGKGLLFMQEDWQGILKQSFDVFTEHEWANHATRTDFSYTLKADNIKEIINNFDFQDLKIITISKNKKIQYLKATNSNIDVVIYDKALHLEEIASDEYKEAFKKKYQETEGVYRIDFRLKNKRTNKDIIPALKKGEDVEKLIFKAIMNRIKIRKKLKTILKIGF
jgi:hypothetical protein